MKGAGSEERSRWQLWVEAGGTGLCGVLVPATTEKELGAGATRAKEQPSAGPNSCVRRDPLPSSLPATLHRVEIKPAGSGARRARV